MMLRTLATIACLVTLVIVVVGTELSVRIAASSRPLHRCPHDDDALQTRRHTTTATVTLRLQLVSLVKKLHAHLTIAGNCTGSMPPGVLVGVRPARVSGNLQGECMRLNVCVWLTQHVACGERLCPPTAAPAHTSIPLSVITAHWCAFHMLPNQITHTSLTNETTLTKQQHTATQTHTRTHTHTHTHTRANSRSASARRVRCSAIRRRAQSAKSSVRSRSALCDGRLCKQAQPVHHVSFFPRVDGPFAEHSRTSLVLSLSLSRRLRAARRTCASWPAARNVKR
jgi:hypothetical protein